MGLKYRNKKTNKSGYSFDSKLEVAVYEMLVLQLKAGELKEIRVKPNVRLTDAKILAIPDFMVTNKDDTESYVEAKGYETDVWRIKRRLWKHYGPGPLLVYKGTYKKPFLHETIVPVPSLSGVE